MSEIGVMHVLDTLALGGAEQAATNLVNELPRDSYRPFLCTTRTEGPLHDALAADVGRLALNRKTRLDVHAIRRLVEFIRRWDIMILHAHGSSLFVSVLASCFPPYPIVIWHAHYGRFALENRRSRAHQVALRRTRGVIAVSRQLAEWCDRRLGVSANHIWCIPNMVCELADPLQIPILPGQPGSRIVCVANLREEKDHLNLIRAMSIVVRRHPSAHLILVGADHSTSSSYCDMVKQEVARHSLGNYVSFLGQRRNVRAILAGCDIGVLSSKVEGLPVSLLEYGAAGLPVVATSVGECEAVLDHGRTGIVVPPESPAKLADGLLSLLDSEQRRAILGERFLHRVREKYCAKSVIERVCNVYRNALQSERTGAAYRESARDSYRA
jgi:glycosyltransferase involved in cell wall biosynthesis